MTYQIRTVYDRKTLTTMARVLRKSVRSRHSRLTHLFGALVIAAGVFGALGPYLLLENEPINWLSLLPAAAVLLVLLFEDTLNGVIAGKKQLPGAGETLTTFDEEGYVTEIQGAQTRWSFDRILHLCETKEYIVFVLSKQHAQAYDKNGFLQGEPASLLRLVAERTGKSVETIR